MLLCDTLSPKGAWWLSTACQTVRHGQDPKRDEDSKTLIRWQNTEPSIFHGEKSCQHDFIWKRKLMCNNAPIRNLICPFGFFFSIVIATKMLGFLQAFQMEKKRVVCSPFAANAYWLKKMCWHCNIHRFLTNSFFRFYYQAKELAQQYKKLNRLVQ